MKHWRLFVSVIAVVYVLCVVGAVYLANHNIELLRQIGTIIGAVGIVFGLALIVKLLSSPPFSTGQGREALRAAFKVLTFRA